MDKKFMERAIALSKEGMEKNAGGPFGAVIVKNGKIIGEGFNMVTSTNDPTAHAEMSAIRKATKKIKDFSLKGCEIYTSCEPCPMCLSAIYWARIDKVYYANSKRDAAKINFDDNFIYKEFDKPKKKRKLEVKQLMRKEALVVFGEWEEKVDRVAY